MTRKPAMDDAARWLAEIKADIEQVRLSLDLAFVRGDWPGVAEAGKALGRAQNRIANLEHLARPENWRELADRNGVHLSGEDAPTKDAEKP